jgi:hypothetical protein
MSEFGVELGLVEWCEKIRRFFGKLFVGCSWYLDGSIYNDIRFSFSKLSKFPPNIPQRPKL